MSDPFAQAAGQMASDMGALLDELGDAGEFVELDVRRFRAQLDQDDEGADRVLEQVAALGRYHRVSALLLEAFQAALVMRNVALARSCFEGVQALVAQARTSEAAEAQDEEHDSEGEG